MNQQAQNRMKTNDEQLMAIDAKDQILSAVGKVEAHQGEGILHRAFTVFLRNSDNQWLITQRSQYKPLWPLWWDAACSSHPWFPDEAVRNAATRRLPFELGVDVEEVINLREVGSYEYHAVYSPDWSENEINHILVGEYDGEIRLNPQEVAQYRWVDQTEFQRLMTQENYFAPWVSLALPKVFR